MKVKMFKENLHQRALRLWITKGVKIPEVAKLMGNAGYLLNNMIAKYTLFSDRYAISEAALRKLKKDGVDLNEIHIRRKFYGKEKPFIYEHSIPAKVIRTEILISDRTEEEIRLILKHSGQVALLLRTEDKKLKDAKLGSSMPSGWKLCDDHKARYKEVGIKLSRKLLKVKGGIVR
jgi:hypothetical protein